MRSYALLVFGLSVLNILIVQVLFQLLPNRFFAGLIAGVLFLIIGVLSIRLAIKLGNPIGRFLFWVSNIHVFIISLPMLISRWSQNHLPMSEVKILGLSGTQFHALSGPIYLLLIASLALELIVLFKKQNKHY